MRYKTVFVFFLVLCDFIFLEYQVNAQLNAPFRHPLEVDWSMTQDFGDWNSAWKGYHLAEDISCNPNAPVYPIGNGVVQYAGVILGYTVIIEYKLPPGDPNGEAICSIYYHLKRPEDGGISLAVNMPVFKTNPIGYVSNKWEDHQSAPHLHFGIRKGEYKKGKDPRTEKWYYPGYTTIYKNDVRQDDQYDPIHQQILLEWLNNCCYKI